MTNRQQLTVFFVMLACLALAAAVYVVVPGGMLDPRSASSLGLSSPAVQMPVWQLVLGNVAIILVLYSLLGLAGYWLACRAGLPGIYRPSVGWRAWAWRPLAIGAGAGLALTAADLAVRRFTGLPGFPHPLFPASILASLTAGIGEEILTRLFVVSLWSLILVWLLGRLFPGRNTRGPALWIANVIGALVFGASHLPSLMIVAGVSSPAALPPLTLAEVFVLNGLVGLLAGAAFQRDGLVAASGIHFWADIVWHVLYGVVAGS